MSEDYTQMTFSILCSTTDQVSPDIDVHYTQLSPEGFEKQRKLPGRFREIIGNERAFQSFLLVLCKLSFVFASLCKSAYLFHSK